MAPGVFTPGALNLWKQNIMKITQKELRNELNVLKFLGLTNEELIGMMSFFNYEVEEQTNGKLGVNECLQNLQQMKSHRQWLKNLA